MSVTTLNPSINYGETTEIIATNFNNISITPNNSVVNIVQSGYNYIITVNPTLTTLYYINGNDDFGNKLNLSTTVYVNVTVLTNLVTTTYNDPISLTAYGSSSYLWTPNEYISDNTESTVLCIPSDNITYTIYGTDIYGTLSSVNLTVNIDTNLIFTPSNPTVYDGNLLNVSVKYDNPNISNISYTWKSNLFNGMPPNCTTLKDSSSIELHPYKNVSYTVNAYSNNILLTSGNVSINVIPKPSNIIDVDIIPYKISKSVFSRNRKELIKELKTYKVLSYKIIDFYYTTLQTAYRMEFTDKYGIPFAVKWNTLYQIKNKSNEMILSFEQQWKFFQYINQNVTLSNFKFLLNTINEIYLEIPQKIQLVPLGLTT
jgi:hypothetical protein